MDIVKHRDRCSSCGASLVAGGHFMIARPASARWEKGMDASVRAGLKKAGVLGAQRHLFLCLGPDCCAPADGEATWDYIKQRIRDTRIPAMRTKASCLRVCSGGPWLVVYPDGIWYGAVTPARFEKILEEHLIAGRPVEEWIAARNPLDGCGMIAD